MTDWESFGVMAGGASSALTGLLFVAVSLNQSAVTRSPSLRASAAQTLVLLVTPLPIAAFLLTPGQPSWALGAELSCLAAAIALVLIIVGRSKRRQSPAAGSRLARILDRRSPNLVTSAILATAGITYAVGVGGGLYWLVPTVLAALIGAALIGGALNAWMFLIEPA